jgi:hypothetical protein
MSVSSPFYFTSQTDPTPVIIAANNVDNNYTSAQGAPEVMIAFKKNDGIYHINLFYVQFPGGYNYSQQGPIHKIPNTTSDFLNPSISINSITPIVLTCHTLQGNIYAYYTLGGNWTEISSSSFNSTNVVSLKNSSITADGQNFFHISWEGYNHYYDTYSILHKRITVPSPGYNTPISEFGHTYYDSYMPSTFGHVDANGGVSIYWSSSTSNTYSIRRIIYDGINWDYTWHDYVPALYSDAYYVNAINKDQPGNFAYCWTSTGTAPYNLNTCIGCTEPGDGDSGGLDSLKTYRRAEFNNTVLDAILSLQLGNFNLLDNNQNKYPLDLQLLDPEFTFQNFNEALNTLFCDTIPRSNVYKKIAFEYSAVLKNLGKVKANNSNNVSIKFKLIDRNTGNTLYSSNSFALPLDSTRRTVSGNLIVPFNGLNQQYDLSLLMELNGMAQQYLNQTDNINLVNTYLFGSESLSKRNETKSNLNQVTEYKLEQNYPNPFNPVTKIKFEVPRTSVISIIVYDVLGREIKELLNEFKPAGTYELTFDGNNLPCGVYFYKLQAEDFIQTRKMVLIR